MSLSLRCLAFKRLAISGLVMTGLLSSPVFAATENCTHSPTHEAFNIQGLKSELMVTALSCNAQEQYNTFISQFRPILSTEESKLKSYFRSTYKARAQREQDDYITQLANVQSSQGLKSGSIFCLQRMDMFAEVKHLKTAEELSQYVEAKDILQPSSFEICKAPVRTTGKRRVTRNRHIVHKKTVHKK